MRPGVDVFSRAQPAPVTIPTDTGVAFVIGPTDPAVITSTVTLTHSLTEFVALCGDRDAAGVAVTYDAADVFFREGGSQLYVASTVAPSVGGLAAQTAKGKTSKTDDAAATQSDAEVAPQLADTGISSALAALTKDLGPGQVFIADLALATVADNQAALTAHCSTNNRVALLSTADGNAAALEAAATALHADQNARYAAVFAPSVIVPGVVPGTTRTVPWAAIQAGIIARNDGGGLNANKAAAGDDGTSLYALDLTATYTDTEYAALNVAGCNMARRIYGVIENYGYRSCADPATSQSDWLEFGNCRLNMAICAEADAIGEHYVFSQIDGRGVTIADFGSELSAMLVPFYTGGSLFGATAAEAFDVNVSAAVNTPQTIANGELHAVISVRMSHMAEWVVIEIVKVATTQALASSVPAALAA